jgi:hypothetical protein
VFFLLLYGYALNFDIRDVRWRCRIATHAREPALVVGVRQLRLLRAGRDVRGAREIGPPDDRDRIVAALVIPRGLARDVRAGRRAGAGAHQRETTPTPRPR